VPDRYPHLNIADFISSLNSYTVFTKLDLTEGYYQVPMSKEENNKDGDDNFFWPL